jgi:hypothetical protein
VRTLFVIAMAPLLLSGALASSMPTLDVRSLCRDVRSLALPEDQGLAYESCLQDEQTAREQLQQRWTQFTADARDSCGEVSEGMRASYVEMLTCLEMETESDLGVGATPRIGRSPSLPNRRP